MYFNPKSTGPFPPGAALGEGGVFHPLSKIRATMSKKVMLIYVKFGIFYDVFSPNMAMPRNRRKKKWKKNYFFLILHLTLGKATTANF